MGLCVCARGACATYVFVGGTKGKREPGTEKPNLFCFVFNELLHYQAHHYSCVIL